MWETIRVSEKRTKADKAQRQADQLEKKTSRRPAQTRKKKLTREGLQPSHYDPTKRLS